MKRRFGVFQGLVLSLFSPAYYRDVANHWGGIGFVYLLLLFLVTWIPVLWHWQTTFGNFVNTGLADSLKDMPKIVIKQGKVSSEVEQPYTVTDPKDGRIIFVLDTTGQIDNLDKTTAQFLLTETQFHIRDQNQRQVHDLRDLPGDMEISKEIVQGWLAAAGKWLGVAAFPFVMVGSMIRALIVMLLAGVVGMIFRPMLNPDISYGSLMRLAAMGLTLPTFLSTGMEFANRAIPFPFWFGITLGLTSLYTLFGARAAAAGPRDLRLDDDLPPRDPPPYEDRGPVSPDAFRAR